MTNEQMRVELPELPRPDKIEQDMDVNLGRVEYRYFCEDATTAYATAAILADRERRAAKDAGDGDVVVTWDEGRTRIVAVTRQDDEGRVIEVIAEAPPAPAEPVSVAVREQLFKMTNAYAKAMKDAGVSYYPEALVIVREARAVIAAAQPTLRTATEELLFADMKTDEQKADFFLSGRAYETGVIAKAIQNDVSMAYRRCAEYAKALAATQQAEPSAKDDNPWLPHNGGPCPVRPIVRVDVKLRNGEIIIDRVALSLFWIHFDAAKDIIEYRLHREGVE